MAAMSQTPGLRIIAAVVREGRCVSHDLARLALVPIPDRIANGGLPAAIGVVTLACLPDCAPHPIHDLGWQRTWSVERADAAALGMNHAHRAARVRLQAAPRARRDALGHGALRAARGVKPQRGAAP